MPPPLDSELPIIGKKVVIRRLSEDDLDPMYDLENDACAKRYLKCFEQRSREEWTALMRRTLDSTSTLAVTTKETGDFAGRASLTQPLELWEPCAETLDWLELSAVIATKYRGHYFGREACQLLIDVAFDQRKSSSVVGLVHPDNKRSLKLCECLGFRQEGKMSDGRVVFRLSSMTPRIWRSETL